MRRDSIALSRYRLRSSIVIVDLPSAGERKLDCRESRGPARARRSGALPRLSRSGRRKLAANWISNPLFSIVVGTRASKNCHFHREIRATCSWFFERMKCEGMPRGVVTKNRRRTFVCERASKNYRRERRVKVSYSFFIRLNFINYNSIGEGGKGLVSFYQGIESTLL